ncbi:proteasomal ubiquitin receptor ADRM1-like [Clavelina lepadiformis]|uniref:Proteasomal ubiquitin receptor ADRM1 n=1 Tax=Clavelina lepadiformis TaxID=159417 RepID=A0ABP0FU57_CLALP
MSLFSNTSSISNKNLVEFRAGKMNFKGKTVMPDKRKGLVYIYQTDDSLMHFCWKDRSTGTTEDDLIIFPDDCELTHVSQCTTGRVYLLKFKSSNRKMFFWMQEPKPDKDEEYWKKVNDVLNNLQSGQNQTSSSGISRLEDVGQGTLQDLFNNMDQQQLLQLMAAGGGLGSLVGSGNLPGRSQRNSTAKQESSSSSLPNTNVSAESSSTSGSAIAPQSQVQLSQLQDILSQMGVPKQQFEQRINFADIVTPESMLPLLSDPKVQERLKPFLPQGETLNQTVDELRGTLHSPFFHQAMEAFGSALATGQLMSVLDQFGLSEAAKKAATKGDVEAFAKALEEDNRKSNTSNDNQSSN